MPAKMPREDYDMLDRFILTVLQRVETGLLTPSQGLGKIMHPLTALIDHGGGSEFAPWMKAHIEQWAADDADRT